MPKRKKNIGRQNLIFLLSSIVALISGISLVGWAEDYPIVWRNSMFMNAPNSMVAISVVIVAFIIAPIIAWFKRQIPQRTGSSSNTGIWLPLLLIGFPLLMCVTQTGIIINGALDKSETRTFSTVVVNKREVRQKSISTYIIVEDWRVPNKTVQVKVSLSNYKAIQIGDSVDLITKSGFLRYEWMVGPDLMRGKWPFNLPDN